MALGPLFSLLHFLCWQTPCAQTTPPVLFPRIPSPELLFSSISLPAPSSPDPINTYPSKVNSAGGPNECQMAYAARTKAEFGAVLKQFPKVTEDPICLLKI